MKKTNLLSLIILLAFSFITFSVVSAGWIAPPANPPLQNADAPINVSSAAQIKDGPLTIGNLFRAKTKILAGGANSALPSKDLVVDIEGKVGAVEYCDNNGDNCISGNAMGSGFWAKLGATNHIYNKNTGNVGIGTGSNTPAAKLDVAGNIKTSAALVLNQGQSVVLDNDDAGDTRIRRYYNGTAGVMELKTDNKVVMNLLGNGNVNVSGVTTGQDFCLPSGVCLSQLASGGTGSGGTVGGTGVSTLHAGPGITIKDFNTGTVGAVSGDLLISATGNTGSGNNLTCTDVEDYDEGTHPWLNWGDVYKESYISCPAGESLVSVVGDCANSSPADGGTIQVDASTWKQRCVHNASQPNPFASSIRGQCCRN